MFINIHQKIPHGHYGALWEYETEITMPTTQDNIAILKQCPKKGKNGFKVPQTLNLFVTGMYAAIQTPERTD